MRAIQICSETGPDDALELAEISVPQASHMMTPGEGVLIDVEAAGVSFPELLQTRGQYQFRPPLPFVPGSEVAGTVRAATGSSDLQPGERVVGFTMIGGWAEVALAPAFMSFRLPDQLDSVEGAGLLLNYLTALFCLRTRGRLTEGETVLVHGGAGGVGTATLQVASGLGATTIAVVSDQAKRQVAFEAGADSVVLSSGPWKDEVLEISGGGVDLVIDPVGGDRFTDSLRALGEGGRVVVVGFAAGSIPEVKVNRLLLKNTEVIGAGWGAWALSKPGLNVAMGRELIGLIENGQVKPLIGERFEFGVAGAAAALRSIDERRAAGKLVLEL